MAAVYLLPDCSADRSVTGPRQSTINPSAQTQMNKAKCAVVLQEENHKTTTPGR